MLQISTLEGVLASEQRRKDQLSQQIQELHDKLMGSDMVSLASVICGRVNSINRLGELNCGQRSAALPLTDILALRNAAFGYACHALCALYAVCHPEAR